MSAPKVVLIAAVAKNGVIGVRGGLPWRIASDMARFRAATMGKPILMGRKTWDSLPRKPLPGRDNLVLSRERNFRARGAWNFTKFDACLAAGAAMAEARGVDEICVVGGSLIYAETLPVADRVILTEVDLAPAGDAYFPQLDPRHWAEVSAEPFARGDKDDASFTVRVLERR